MLLQLAKILGVMDCEHIMLEENSYPLLDVEFGNIMERYAILRNLDMFRINGSP